MKVTVFLTLFLISSLSSARQTEYLCNFELLYNNSASADLEKVATYRYSTATNQTAVAAVYGNDVRKQISIELTNMTQDTLRFRVYRSFFMIPGELSTKEVTGQAIEISPAQLNQTISFGRYTTKASCEIIAQ